jgi:hypothetical protein
VFLTRFRTYKITLPTPNKTYDGRGLRQINSCHYWSVFKKSLHLGFGVFLDILSMVFFSVVQAGGGDRLKAGARIAPLQGGALRRRGLS